MSAPEPRRKPLIVANWKMNKNISETSQFIQAFLPLVATFSNAVDVALCPPFTALSAAHSLLKGSAVALGAQNLSENSPGAFTGEISGSMLTDVGCRYVILGHSERRQYQKESDALINKKIGVSFASKLIPIFCVGESLAEREAGQTTEVIRSQLSGGLKSIPSQQMQQIVIAYEPVWAIGTGKTATPQQAQEVHLFIRDFLKDQYGSLTSLVVRILYGGSVKPDNMATLMACEDIDGGLVGGASLDAASFASIVGAAA